MNYDSYVVLKAASAVANQIQQYRRMEKRALPWGMLARGGMKLLSRYLAGTARGMGVGLGSGAGVATGAYITNKLRRKPQKPGTGIFRGQQAHPVKRQY